MVQEQERGGALAGGGGGGRGQAGVRPRQPPRGQASAGRVRRRPPRRQQAQEPARPHCAARRAPTLHLFISGQLISVQVIK